MEKRVIAVFGGSFNPLASSHISLAKQILEKIKKIEKIIFVPVNVMYNKKGLASNEDRLCMIRSVCESNENLEVSTVELDSQRQLFTIETLNLIQGQYPESEIYFVLGTDNLKELEAWYKSDELLKSFKILVLERGNDKAEEVIENNKFLRQYSNSFVILTDLEKIDLSSSEIRAKVKNGEDIDGLVPEEIKDKVLQIYV